MKPIIIEPPETALCGFDSHRKNRPPCSSCLVPAEIVWMDQWGTVPLCKACGENRQKAWEKHQKEGAK